MVITYDFLAKYGQLGNQMFQYALLLGVKHKLNCDIIIDPEVKNRSYLFNFFDLQEPLIQNIQIDNIYQEGDFHFNPEVFEIKEDTNFRGYFQSEKYFEHCKDIVKKEFTFKSEINDKIINFLNPFINKRLVSVHVRRGDYLVHPDAHPLCTLEYYNKAMDMLDGDDVMFICTSDDKEWCEDNLKRDNIVFNKSDLAYDMCLISKCNDHIIANSSFSWWGSWLGSDENKKIIAPNVWFGDRYKHYDVKDIYRSEFIIL
jgi:hypothetical protein